MNKLSQIACCVILAGTYAPELTAQERQGLLLNAGASLVSDNNVLRNKAEKDDTYFLFTPEISFLANMGKHQFSAKYEGSYSAYSDLDELNYTDHDLGLVAKLDHTTKVNTEFSFSFIDAIEEPGSNNSVALVNNFNKTEFTKAAAKLFYGTYSSTGQLLFEANHQKREYTNNAQQFRDVNINKLSATFFYRIAPKTRILFQASSADFEYQKTTLLTDQSSTERFYLTGITWELTAKTSGTFKIGYQDKNFDQNLYADIDGLSYSLDMTWKPSTHTTFTIEANRQTKESARQSTAGFINKSYGVLAEHEFTARTKLKARIGLDDAEYTNRTDSRTNIMLSVSHSLLTWLDVSLDYKSMNRDSNEPLFDFDSQSFGLTFETRFE